MMVLKVEWDLVWLFGQLGSHIYFEAISDHSQGIITTVLYLVKFTSSIAMYNDILATPSTSYVLCFFSQALAIFQLNKTQNFIIKRYE